MKNKKLFSFSLFGLMLLLGPFLMSAPFEVNRISGFSFIVFMAACFQVFVLAGSLLVFLLLNPKEQSPFEILTLAFSFNLIPLVGVAILTFEFHWNAPCAAYALFAVQWILWLMLGLKWNRSVQNDPTPILRSKKASHLFHFLSGGLLIIAAFFFSWCYFNIGGFLNGFYPSHEELSHISVIRKLAENAAIAFNNIFYRPDLQSTYLYAPYHLALAMLSHLTHMDVMAVYSKWRAFSVILSFAVFYSVIKVLFQSRWLSVMSTGLMMALVFSQWVGDRPDHYWAQFAPYAYPTDVAACLFLPALCYVFFKSFAADETHRKTFLYLTPFLVLALAIVHVREACYFLLYGGFIMAGVFFFRPHADRKQMIRGCLTVIVITIVLGFLFKLRYQMEPSLYGVAEEIKRAKEWMELKTLFSKKQFWIFSPDFIDFFLGQVSLLFGGAFGFIWLLLPLGIVFRKHRGICILLSICFFSLLILRTAWLRKLLVYLTYSELFMIPVRLMSFWLYVSLAIFFCAVILIAERKPASFLLIAPLLVWGNSIFSGVSNFAMRFPDLFLGWIFFGSVAIGLVFWRLRPQGFNLERWVVPIHPGRRIILFLGILLLGVTCSPRPLLWAQFFEKSPRPDVLEGEAWYRQTPLQKSFPHELVQFIRNEMPPHALFAIDFKYNFHLPMLANQYIVSAGYAIQEEIPFLERYLRLKGEEERLIHPEDSRDEKMRKYYGMLDYHMRLSAGRQPLFHEQETIEDIAAYVRAMDADYILVHPEHADYLPKKLNHAPRHFKKIYDSPSHKIYQVIRESY